MLTDYQIAIFRNSIKENYILYSKILSETRMQQEGKEPAVISSPHIVDGQIL